jgi:uncharacterized protein
MDKVEQLTRLFMRLDAGESPDTVRTEAREFLSTVGPREVAMAEQSLIRSGINVEQLRSRCLTHVALLPDQSYRLRLSLPANHIVRIILAEHEMMLCFLADLEELNTEIQHMSYCAPTSVEMRKLSHIVSHLVVANDHEWREDEVIFPELERNGYFGPSEMVKLDRASHEACKKEMSALTHPSQDKSAFAKFKLHLDAAVRYFVPAMRQQIFTEDNILYPVAIEVITSKSVWDRIKANCELIGYCGFDGRS